MTSQPLNSTSSPLDTRVDENAKAKSACNENTYRQTSSRLIHTCQNLAIVAAIALSASCANAFSTGTSNSNGRSAIINRNIQTQSHQPIPIRKRAAFISSNSRSHSISSTAIFATQKKVKKASKTKKTGKSDKEEWDAVLDAFQMYKAAYGDLKVPSRFVVPSMPPWPGE